MNNWFCKTCNHAFPPDALLPGAMCLICPNCGQATIKPAWQWIIDEQAEQIATLKAALITATAYKIRMDDATIHHRLMDCMESEKLAKLRLAREYPEIFGEDAQ